MSNSTKSTCLFTSFERLSRLVAILARSGRELAGILARFVGNASHFLPHDPRPDSQKGKIGTITEQILV